MKQKEIIAAIHQMKEQLANCQCQIAILEELLTKEVNENPVVTPTESPVNNTNESTTLPNPPKEITINLPKSNIPDEDCVLGCKIITKLGINYDGVCSVVKIHKQYFDNGQSKLYINKYKVVIDLYNSKMEVIKSITTHWNNLSEFHKELIARGINTHAKENWMPKTILLDLD